MGTQFLTESDLRSFADQEPNLGGLSQVGGAFQRGSTIEAGCQSSGGLCITALLDASGKQVVEIVCPSYAGGACSRNGQNCPNTVPTVSLESKQAA